MPPVPGRPPPVAVVETAAATVVVGSGRVTMVDDVVLPCEPTPTDVVVVGGTVDVVVVPGSMVVVVAG